MSETKLRGFVAFPFTPKNLQETLHEAIVKINRSDVAKLTLWSEVASSGRVIMKSVCEAIADFDLFIADATDLNANVLFELGYAIAQEKRVWVLLNTATERAVAAYHSFRVLTSVSYASYTNSRDIVSKFYDDNPVDVEQPPLLADFQSVSQRTLGQPSLLYVKTPIETNESIRLSRTVEKTSIPLVVDDPIEASDQPLSWYVQELARAHAVVVHLLSSEHKGWREHNAKASLIAGLAHGLAKHVLILAHSPFARVVDYDELRRVHETARECEQYASEWLEFIEHEYQRLPQIAPGTRSHRRAQASLRELTLGDWQAERESESLSKYFVETAPYAEAISAQESLIIGDIGAGKTAVVLRAAAELARRRGNHICLIQPGPYEWEGLVRAFTNISEISEQGFLIESLWKFLLYTELAKSLYEELTTARNLPPSRAEENLLHMIESNKAFILGDFTLRLEAAVEALEHSTRNGSLKEQRTRASELLHDTLIRDLRSVLGNCLQDRDRVAIFVDNLDKGWPHQEKQPILARLILGLIGLPHRLWLDFRKQDHWRRDVNLTVALFLRSDIFAEILRLASEPHKLIPTRIAWDDSDTLMRILDRRMEVSLGPSLSIAQIWEQYFCERVGEMSTREYLASSVLPRPRDLILLAREALTRAQNAGHTKIDEDDILAARLQYSRYALRLVLNGGGNRVPNLEDFLTCFLEGPAIVDQEFLHSAAHRCGLSNDETEMTIGYLTGSGFLGIEVSQDTFGYALSPEDAEQTEARASRYQGKHSGLVKRYRVNDPFHPYLEIS